MTLSTKRALRAALPAAALAALAALLSPGAALAQKGETVRIAWIDPLSGLMAPAATPRDIVARLNAELNAGLASPEMRDRFHKLGAEARPGTPDDFKAFIVQEIPKWQAMAKLAGVKGE